MSLQAGFNKGLTYASAAAGVVSLVSLPPSVGQSASVVSMIGWGLLLGAAVTFVSLLWLFRPSHKTGTENRKTEGVARMVLTVTMVALGGWYANLFALPQKLEAAQVVSRVSQTIVTSEPRGPSLSEFVTVAVKGEERAAGLASDVEAAFKARSAERKLKQQTGRNIGLSVLVKADFGTVAGNRVRLGGRYRIADDKGRQCDFTYASERAYARPDAVRRMAEAMVEQSSKIVEGAQTC